MPSFDNSRRSDDDAQPAGAFAEGFACTLKVKAGTEEITVPGGQVKGIRVDAFAYGFAAEIDFWLTESYDEDGLAAAIGTATLLQVDLSIDVDIPLLLKRPDALVLKGVVTEWSVLETSVAGLKGTPVVARHYAMRFADPLRVLFGHHFPSVLHETKSVKDLISTEAAAMTAPAVTITYDDAWTTLTTARPFVCVALGGEQNVRRNPAASFYDFVMGFTDHENGHVLYDFAAASYKLAAARPAPGEAKHLDRRNVGTIEVVLPHLFESGRVLNSCVLAMKTTDIARDAAVPGVRRDTLITVPTADLTTARVDLETTRLTDPKPERHVVFADYPENLLLVPGAIVDFTHASFSTALFGAKKTYRVEEVHLAARALDPNPATDRQEKSARYTTDLRTVLAEVDDTRPRLPTFVAPRYPFHVEGTIVSEQGEEAEETYQIYPDDKTSVDQYKVKVPLFADQHVVAPYNPNGLPPHFYFPAIKGARVLVSLWLDRARIKRFLDWRPGGRLPADTQGNHLLLGLTDKSHVTMTHVYEEKKPVLRVKRVLEKDTELLELTEGSLVLQTREEE